MAGFIYLTRRISAFGFIKKLSKDKKVLKYAISAGLIVLTGGIIWLIWDWINAIICLLHLVIFWLLCDLFVFIGKKISKKQASKCLAGFIAVPLTVVYLAVGWYLCSNVWETDYTLKTDKKSGDIRIVQFADSHVGTTFHGDGFAKYMEEIQKLDPDVVLITGDFVDDDTSKEDMIQCCAVCISWEKRQRCFVPTRRCWCPIWRQAVRWQTVVRQTNSVSLSKSIPDIR